MFPGLRMQQNPSVREHLPERPDHDRTESGAHGTRWPSDHFRARLPIHPKHARLEGNHMNRSFLRLSAFALTLASSAAWSADTAIDTCIKAIKADKPGSLLKLEKLETADGKTLYEFELKDAKGAEHEYMCDATGKIVETEGETESDKDKAFAAKAKISEDQAKQIALKAAAGKIEEIEFEIEADGAPSYEIDIVSATGVETKLEVDAVSGKIIEQYTEVWEIGEEADERP